MSMCNLLVDIVASMAWGSRAVHAGRAFGALVREPSCSSGGLARSCESNGGSAIRALKLPRGLFAAQAQRSALSKKFEHTTSRTRRAIQPCETRPSVSHYTILNDSRESTHVSQIWPATGLQLHAPSRPLKTPGRLSRLSSTTHDPARHDNAVHLDPSQRERQARDARSRREQSCLPQHAA